MNEELKYGNVVAVKFASGEDFRIVDQAESRLLPVGLNYKVDSARE
jgi:hypothetical protein